MRRVPVERPAPVYRQPRTSAREESNYGDYTKEDEIEDLKAYAEDLEEELELVEERINELSE